MVANVGIDTRVSANAAATVQQISQGRFILGLERARHRPVSSPQSRCPLNCDLKLRGLVQPTSTGPLTSCGHHARVNWPLHYLIRDRW